MHVDKKRVKINLMCTNERWKAGEFISVHFLIEKQSKWAECLQVMHLI